MLKLIGTCVQAKASDVEAYDQTERLITLDEFRKNCDLLDYYNLAKSLGYALRKDYGALMHQDWHVKFGIGTYKGKNVMCVHHSAMHYFYTYERTESNMSVAHLERKPKLMIDGELHKHCKGCDEYYPATKEFFFGTCKLRQNLLEARCKACYVERYKKPKLKTGRTNNIRSVYGKLALNTA